MINLYIFNESSRAAVYGIGTYIRELTAALKNSDINVCVIHLRTDKSNMLIEEKASITHWYIPECTVINQTKNHTEQSERYYQNIIYLLQLYIKDRTNLIFHLNYNQSKPLAVALKRVFNCKIVIITHYSNPALILHGNLSRFRTILTKAPQTRDDLEKEVIASFEQEKGLFYMANHIICLSGFMKQILCREYGLLSPLLTVIPNGLGEHNILTDRDKIGLRSHWLLPPDEKIILFVGRLDDAKGILFLIRAFHKVLGYNSSCHLIITGNGSYDKILKESECIWTKIHFTGLISKERLYDLYSIADIGVIPSFHEQCSYAAIEMMMHSLPMITTSAPGLAEMTEDGISSLQVPVKEHPDRVEIDTDLLAEKILYLLEHPKDAKQLGKNARKRYEERYSSNIFRENMLNFYHSLYE